MIVMVDAQEEAIEGFKFTNKFGNVEGIGLYRESSRAYFKFETASGSVDYYFEDIPKLIKALQAAQEHYKKVKES